MIAPQQAKLFPALRFGEFGESWVWRRIQSLIDDGSIVSHLDGNHGELYPRADEFSTSGVPYISANDFVNGDVELTRCKFLPTERASKFKKGIAKDGDVLFAHNATVGPTAILNTDHSYVILSTTATYFRCATDVIARSFLRASLQSDYFIRQYTRVMSQSTRNQVPITMQRQFYLQIPTLQEQLKIADFLTAVDARIGQLNQKKALLEDYKKGVMQQLFSQAIRFKDDDESEYPDWEDRKLGEITKWASGGTPSKDQPAFWGGDIPWISAVSMHGRNYSESPLKLTVEGAKSGSRLAVKDSLLLLVRGSMLWNRIPVGIAACDVAFNQDVKALVTTDEIEVNYLLQWFIASENMLLHKVVGTGIGAGKLDTDEMKNLTVELP